MQQGSDINGEDSLDRFGGSVSMPDTNTLAIGGYLNDGIRTNAGHVRIYEKSGNRWVQKGLDIDGDSANDQSGYSVSMPNANIVAIGSWRSDDGGAISGKVKVYEWSDTSWSQKGMDIIGENVGDQSGWSIVMPNNNTIAVSAPFNSENGVRSGHVRVYEWSGINWTQKGADIDGDTEGDVSGQSISMPDSNTIAIGAGSNDNANGNNSGHVRVYHWNGANWQQKGADINGEDAEDLSGRAVSMPDPNTLAVGAPFNDGNGPNAGHVRVFHWSGSSWIQKGSDIDGEVENDLAGEAVSMPDSNTIAIGSIYNDENGSRSGQVRIFEWKENNWQQKGDNINGEAIGDEFGNSIDMPNANTFVAGGWFNDTNGTDAGYARVFRFIGTTSLNELELSKNFNIYPNPSNGGINLETTNYSLGELVQITSITGVVLKEFTISQNREIIELSSFENGLYFLKFNGITRKIVIKK